MCYSPWGRRELDTTERLYLTELYSTGNCTKYLVITYNVKDLKRIYMYYVYVYICVYIYIYIHTHIYLNHFAIHLKLA